MAYFKTLPQHFSGGIRENQEEFQDNLEFSMKPVENAWR
jgi:hypothetical protein